MTFAVVFDAYGTLFDVHSAVARMKDEIGPSAQRLSELWRSKHLEYTWVLSLAGRYESFRMLAARSLDTAAALTGAVPPGIRERLLAAYTTLDAYAEVPRMLDDLRSLGRRTAILSNGDSDMLASAVAAAGLDGRLDAVISVEGIRVFKPSPRVYALATQRLSLEPAGILFVSSNRWDIAGARAFGFRTLWVNRTGAPDEYPDLAPDAVAPDLTGLVRFA
jgi:2-haloacid dehalogenase